RLSRQELESLSRKNRQTVVEIVLSRTGEFTGSLVHGTSGDGELDQTSVESFKRAAPFLNPPQGMVESDGRIRLKYAFHLRFRPPSFGPAEM
ncbi:MAG TPA: TonB C-terminal domain-containing protein, partial [Bdellovibrionales bacterium]|nr:TonB C-terminal domain-containing protein [Bdellovibrionales bacterium]